MFKERNGYNSSWHMPYGIFKMDSGWIYCSLKPASAAVSWDGRDERLHRHQQLIDDLAGAGHVGSCVALADRAKCFHRQTGTTAASALVDGHAARFNDPWPALADLIVPRRVLRAGRIAGTGGAVPLDHVWRCFAPGH